MALLHFSALHTPDCDYVPEEKDDMPGLTAAFIAGPVTDDESTRFKTAQKRMLHGETYRCALDFCEAGLLAGHVCYPEYPFRAFSRRGIFTGIEGRVYNKSPAAVDEELVNLAAAVFDDAHDSSARMRRWILETDGEYVVIFASPQYRRLVVLCDPHGHLPLYYYADDERLLLAREGKFVQAAKPRPAFDAIAWAQYLCFGHPLGRRTLFSDVQHAPGGALIDARLKNGRISSSISALFAVNYDEHDESGISLRHYAAELAEVFTEVCRQRGSHPDGGANIVSLSGGQDSRCIAAALDRAGTSFVTATCSRLWQAVNADAAIALRVAETLHVPWQLFPVPRATPEQVERHVYMKDGLVYVGTAHAVPYHEALANTWGCNSLVFTGCGGETNFYDFRPYRRVGSVDALVEHILRRYGAVRPEALEKAVRLSVGEFAEEMRAVFANYPEQTCSGKAVHFFLDETARNHGFEGEDRHRFFIWETAPYYAMPMFSRCARIPAKFKQDNRLYCLFQTQLSAACSRLPDATQGLPPASKWFPLMMKIRRLSHSLPEPLEQLFRCVLKKTPAPYPQSAEAQKVLRAALAPGAPLSAVLSAPGVENLLTQGGDALFQRLWTLAVLDKTLRAL